MASTGIVISIIAIIVAIVSAVKAAAIGADSVTFIAIIVASPICATTTSGTTITAATAVFVPESGKERAELSSKGRYERRIF